MSHNDPGEREQENPAREDMDDKLDALIDALSEHVALNLRWALVRQRECITKANDLSREVDASREELRSLFRELIGGEV